MNQRLFPPSLLSKQAYLIGCQRRLNIQGTGAAGQGAVVQYDFRHDTHPEAQAHHTDDGLIASHLGIDMRLDAQLSKPAVHPFPGQAFLGKDHGNIFPGSFSRAAAEPFRQLGLPGLGNKQ